MPRLTIIGNSHVGAFKEGWDAIAPKHPDWEVTFFAATAPRFQNLRLTKDLVFGLLPETADKDPKLRRAVLQINHALSTDLSAADAVLWAGFRRPLDEIVTYLETHDVEGLTVRGGLPLVPRAEFDGACDAIAEARVPGPPWLGWRRPLLALHNTPIPAETLLCDDGAKFATWSGFARRPDGQRAAIEAFYARYEAVLAARRILFLRAPEETLLASGLTAARFTAGSHRLMSGAEHPPTDHRHMNGDYGRLALAALFAALGPALERAATEPSVTEPKRPRDGAIESPGYAAAALRGNGGRRARERRERDRIYAASAPTHAAAVAQAAVGDAPAASPYIDLPARAYWRTAVSERSPLDPGDLYRPRFPVTRKTRIATAGSCFAQHVGRALREAGFDVLDAEPRPSRIPEAAAGSHGYGLFSGRFGNIYTARQLAQLFEEVEGRITPALPAWRKGDRFFDAQRPGVEPEGLDSPGQVRRHRERHLACLRDMFREADLFVFTFGLTEAWTHRETGTVYPTAPGTIAGAFDSEVFAFKNFDVAEVLADFEAFRTALKAVNPTVRFLVTVSPVPLTATATGGHVEVATCYSKAVLRAVCGILVARHEDIDYFPSFEIITSQNARGAYYEPNMRNVSPMGVQTAMQLFLRSHGVEAAAQGRAETARKPGSRRPAKAGEDPCEDALLQAFAK